MAETGNCSGIVQGIGAKQCIKGNVLKQPSKAYLSVPGFQFLTFSDFMDKTKIDEAVAAQNIYPLEIIKDIEDASIEAIVVETADGGKIKNRDGKSGFIAYMDMTLAQNKNFQDYNNSNFEIFLVDDAGNLVGYSPDGIVVRGFSMSYFNVMPMSWSLGTDSYSRTGMEIQFEDNYELNQGIVVALGSELDFNAKDIDPLTVVTVSDVSITTGVITASFFIVDDTIASKPSVPITALTVDDLVVIDQTGAVVTPDAVTATTTEGIWEIDVTTPAMTSGTIQQVSSADSLFYSEVTAVTV